MSKLSRREFLRLGALSSAAAGLLHFRDWLPENEVPPIHGYGRIAWDWLPVRDRPSFNGNQVGRRNLDQVIPLLEEVISEEGPAYNPRWYRVVGGYLFSGYVQPVTYALQAPVSAVNPDGQLVEVSVPYSDSVRWERETGWQPLYRLYYKSTHWVTSIEEGPDGQAWYVITDDLHRQEYAVRAEHVRLVSAAELAPISPDIPLDDKEIVISIAEQSLTAIQSGEAVFSAPVATGVPTVGTPSNGIPTDTPYGAFRINRKMPVRHMGNGDLVSNLTNYELPGVPWVCFFVSTGVAIHGAYWHDNFGRRMSHGCVNMRPEDAKWIYRWTLPAGGPDDWYVESPGTVVRVI